MAVTMRLLALHSAMASLELCGADQEAAMYPTPQRDIHNAEQLGRERYKDLERTSAHRAELGIQKPKLRESIRHWYRRLTGRKPAER